MRTLHLSCSSSGYWLPRHWYYSFSPIQPTWLETMVGWLTPNPPLHLDTHCEHALNITDNDTVHPFYQDVLLQLRPQHKRPAVVDGIQSTLLVLLCPPFWCCASCSHNEITAPKMLHINASAATVFGLMSQQRPNWTGRRRRRMKSEIHSRLQASQCVEKKNLRFVRKRFILEFGCVNQLCISYS